MKEKGPILLTRNLAVGYRGKKSNVSILLDNLNLSVEEGELICLLGINGSGKSTLLRTIAGIQKPIEGEILIGDIPLASLVRIDIAKKLSVVLTENFDVGSITVESIVSMGRYPHNNWLGILREEDFRIINNVFELTGLSRYRGANFLELSDGIRQKVMIARALAQDTPLILLDEPTVYLDIPNKLEIMQILRTLAKQLKKSIILTSHDLDLALQSADIIWLIGKDGKIEVDVPEDLVLNGHFESAFNNEEIKFNPQYGIFRMNLDYKTALKISGNREEVFWTERALHRIGIATGSRNEYSGAIDIRKAGDRIEWRLTLNSQLSEFYSIKELLKFLDLNLKE